MAGCSGSKRKRRRGASAGGADLISGNGDDVLVRILELLPDAEDAVRTGALSRRWRGLWTRASSLNFDSGSRRNKFRSASVDQQFLDFVHKALAQRAKTDNEAALEHLAISFPIMSPVDDEATKPLTLRSSDAAKEWIWYAMQKTAKSFVLKLDLFPIFSRYYCHETNRCIWQERPVMDLINLPSSAKLETMHWQLKGVRLQLPATAVFASLVDLSLENIELVDGSGHLLSRLLSSACCPSLQRLNLLKLSFPDRSELLIEASALLELSLSIRADEGPATLKLKTPSLRILHFQDFVYHRGTLGIYAPKLEELTFLPSQPYRIEVDGELPCVRNLKIELASHGLGYGDDYDANDGGICLLRCCTSLTCLEVSLFVILEQYRFADIISGRIPQLPQLISLTVHVHSSNLHPFGVGLSDILKQCSCLKYLRVDCSIDTHPACHGVDLLCNHSDHWKSHQIYLAKIQEVLFTGLAGTGCESSFIQRVLAHATQLQKVALSFDQRFKLYNMIDGSGFIPCSGGTWVCHDSSLSHEWNSDSVHYWVLALFRGYV